MLTLSLRHNFVNDVLSTKVCLTIENAAELWLQKHSALVESQDGKALAPVHGTIKRVMEFALIRPEVGQRTALNAPPKPVVIRPLDSLKSVGVSGHGIDPRLDRIVIGGMHPVVPRMHNDCMAVEVDGHGKIPRREVILQRRASHATKFWSLRRKAAVETKAMVAICPNQWASRGGGVFKFRVEFLGGVEFFRHCRDRLPTDGRVPGD